MKAAARTLLMLLFLTATAGKADDVLFQDDFQGKLGEGWSWVRERRGAWRVTGRGLEVRIEPGNMWGPANDANYSVMEPLIFPDPR